MTKKSLTLHVLLAFLVLVILIAVQIPANLIFSQLSKQPQFNQMLSFSSVDGTLWKGRLSDVMVQHGANRLALGRVEWRINPLFMLAGKVKLHLKAQKDSQTIEADIAIGLTKTLMINNALIQVPVGLVTQFYPVPGIIEGQIEAVIKELDVDMQGLRAVNAKIQLVDINYTLSQPVELGNYQIDITMQKELVKANLADTVATVGVTGFATFAPKTRLYDIDVKLLPKPTANPLIEQTLSQFLSKTSDGGYKITQSAQL